MIAELEKQRAEAFTRRDENLRTIQLLTERLWELRDSVTGDGAWKKFESVMYEKPEQNHAETD